MGYPAPGLILRVVAIINLAWLPGCEIAPPAARSGGPSASPWEDAIRAFEEADRQSPPPADAILFIGSSSIRLWNLKDYFPDLAVINRGFGGSCISDAVEFAPRIAIPYQPRIVVLYAGDNDIKDGKPPGVLLADFKAFAALLEERLPATRIVFISIKPSPARWELFERMREANQEIRAFIATDPRLTYVDVVPAMLGADGKPRPELFVEDQLHLSPAGYRLWTSLLSGALAASP
jgi:lysophospholipase L1-like esterase